jgi:electron transport complex protein RnfB
LAKIAFIREQDCIGCGKCLPVCPVDAIVGAPKWMHTVIEQDCISCEKCLPACPVDCIDLLDIQQNFDSHERSAYIRTLAQRRKVRLAAEADQQKSQFEQLKNSKNYLQDLFKR